MDVTPDAGGERQRQIPHLRVLPGGADTGDPAIDSMLELLAETVAVLDTRFIIARIDDIEQTPGRYFELSLDEAAEMAGAESLRTVASLGQIDEHFEKHGWALYLRLPESIVRITS